MRSKVLAYLNTVDLGSFALSQELPFSNSGVELYLRNAKRIYVDHESSTTEVFIGLLGSKQIDMEVVRVNLFFASDAKNQPSDYNQVLNAIRSAQDLYIENGFFRRQFSVGSEYKNDLQVTTATLSYNKLI